MPTRHGDTFVIVSGPPSAPPLVLLHGACSNSVTWAGDVAEYSRHFRVYAVDLPGESGRSAPTRPSWQGPSYVEWLEDLLGALHAESVSLLGLSMGGWVALKFATARPDRVHRLALLAPGGVVQAKLSFLIKSIFLSLLGRWGANALNRAVFGKQPIHPRVMHFMNLVMTHFRPRMGALPKFTDADLRRLTMPTLLIAGEEDAVLPARPMAERLTKQVPGCTARLLPDTCHALVNLTGETILFLVA